MSFGYNRSRRKFLYNLGLAGLSIPLISSNSNCSNEQSNPKTMNKKEGKLGIALVGLGGYAGGQLAPALQQTEHCYLAGIVTGTPSKIPVWQKKYDIPDKNVYNYDNYDSIKNNPDIDIIYVVLPNSMHEEYTVRAAQAGKHAICEKPMALSVKECDNMIEACKNAGKMLSIGYRLHFEPYNLEMVRLGTNKVYGAIKNMKAGFGFPAGDPNQWRLKKNLAGGGPLQDVGIYCIQGICYTTGLEPISVIAQEGPKTDLEKFKEVEQSITWQFEMPGGILCDGKASYSEGLNFLHADAENGFFELSPAFNYSGLAGIDNGKSMDFPQVNQQARQMDAFALSIKNKQPSTVPGEMGRRDVKLIAAIYDAAKTGNKISIS
ncbi:MAG TPA: Gfo/Idh/MocA family oxidoreductase [Chitinophagaceae bacterium]|nr:Gfo/Idh/MocA family oxidoreductase [Chitinophagaceae bacterium]